jgi:uncharacterized protein (TIGR02594 family)
MTIKHLEIAWSQDGVAEVRGPGSSKSVLNYFRENGRAEVMSDEVPWCAAFYFWCLDKAGIDISSIAKEDRLLAFSATRLGTRLKEPRVGCGVVMKRYNPDGTLAGHHVGFVTAWTERTIFILGGNQANAVNEMERKRTDDMIFMWPVPPAKPSEVAAAGSRTAKTAGRQQADAAKSTAAQSSNLAVPEPPAVDASTFPAPDVLTAKTSALQNAVSGFESFALFAWGKWPWIAGAVAFYYLARMAWDAGLIRFWRTEDHNTGKAVAAPPAAAPAAELEEVSLV